MKDGRCTQVDPEIFFPTTAEGSRIAKTICAHCDVQAQCLVYALENDERFGVWGGMNAEDRRENRSVVAQKKRAATSGNTRKVAP
jgi:WhiB family redox-sensing transcriptional regulator